MLGVKVSRNDPCPCGSGQKYKKCCGKQKTVSITSIIEKEIQALQAQIIQYTVDEFEIEMEADFESKIDDILTEDENELDFYQFVHSVWFALFFPVEKGKTPLQLFIEEQSRYIQRPKVKEILLSWTNPRPVAGRMLSLKPDSLILKDTLTKEEINVKLLDPIDAKKNDFAFGILVPFGSEPIFFPIVFDLEGEKDGKEEKYLQEEFSLSRYQDPTKFLTGEFLRLMNELPFATVGFGVNDFEWTSPEHKDVALLYEKEMQKLEAPSTNIATGIILWAKYCQKEPKLIKRPATYAAAIHYINMTVSPLIDVTKKEIALIYGISPSTLGTAIMDLEFALQDEIRELKSLHLEQIIEMLESEGIGFDDDFEDELDEWDDEENWEDDDEWDDDLPF